MNKFFGINNAHIKNINRGLVLQCIACNDGLSRVDISKRIGLTKMAVTNIVNELINDGFVVEKDIVHTAFVGRNPVILDIAENAPFIIGLYISRTKVSVVVTDLRLRLQYQNNIIFRHETSETLTKKLFKLTDDAIKYQKNKNSKVIPIGIGVSAIGPLDTATGEILKPTNFFGIQNLNVVGFLQDRYGLPVFLENDMDAAALAEKLFGVGRPYANFLYLGITSGIGSGIITNGKLYRGTSGFVGEIGHMSVSFDGIPCDCGNRGCLEMYINLPIILQQLRDVTGKCDIIPKDFESLSKIDGCNAVFEDTVNKLSAALVNATNMLDPECIIIGHEGVYLPNKYINYLQEHIGARILSSGYKTLAVLKSSFGEHAPLFGSACCVLQKLFEGYVFDAYKKGDTNV